MGNCKEKKYICSEEKHTAIYERGRKAGLEAYEKLLTDILINGQRNLFVGGNVDRQGRQERTAIYQIPNNIWAELIRRLNK